MVNPRRRLESWKEIGEYVGRDVRTVMRWERDRGLPVHRLPGGRGSTVFALPEEIDAWLGGGLAHANGGAVHAPAALVATHTTSPALLSWWTRMRLPLALAIPVLALAGWFAIERSSRIAPAQVANVAFTGQRLVATSDAGAELWGYDFGRPLAKRVAPSAVSITDVDGDGLVEVIAGIPFEHREGGGFSEEVLFCFSSAGQVKWQLAANDRLTFNNQSFGPPWAGSYVLTYGPPRARAIAWAVHHYTWWPAEVMRVSPQGRITHRFAHPGWLTHLAATADGSRIVASGTNNALDANVSVILNGREFGGGAPLVGGGTPYSCDGCTPWGVQGYFVFPRTEISRAGLFPFSMTLAQVRRDDSMEIRIAQTPNDPEVGEVLYEINPSLHIVASAYSDSYWRWHARLESDGRLSHTAATCPSGRPPGPRVWTPGAALLQIGGRAFHVIQPVRHVARREFED